jgi:hypothetical protein
MLANGTPLFLLVPDSGKKRILHPGKVIGLTDGVFLAQFDNKLTLEEGTEVVAFHTERNKFLQQGAQIVTQTQPTEYPGVAFRLTGEPTSAEQRQIYRVSTTLADITARIGKEANCQIVDVSSEGCAAVTRNEYAIGSAVSVSFTYDCHNVSADARVQTVKVLSPGSYRYGFYVPDKKSPARKALTAIVTAVQREQLKRISRAA